MIKSHVMIHVKETVFDLRKTGRNLEAMSFQKLRSIVENGYRVMTCITSDRYTAMILSYIRGHTTDEDVLWHRC